MAKNGLEYLLSSLEVQLFRILMLEAAYIVLRFPIILLKGKDRLA